MENSKLIYNFKEIILDFNLNLKVIELRSTKFYLPINETTSNAAFKKSTATVALKIFSKNLLVKKTKLNNWECDVKTYG